MVLSAHEICVTAGKKTLLQKINLEVKQGEFWMIAGCNGAGKSTFLKTLAGEITPSSGTVLLKGSDLKRMDANTMARHRSVLSQQNYMQFPFTARQIMAMGTGPSDPGPKKTETLIDQFAHELEITALLDRPYPVLSGGEQQRVQLGRVFIQSSICEDAPLILLDEPTSALDIAQQHLVMNILLEKLSKGYTLIAVVHDLNLAARYASHILFLKNGECVAKGPVEKMICSAIIEKTYQQPVSVWKHPTLGCPMIVAEACDRFNPLCKNHKIINNQQLKSVYHDTSNPGQSQ
ncbi:MAG: heme ABC transporter ATP-binding protein [Cyclobacteriaceae bacterium]|nr:heme ABC transporter ATP-binding protein [Cyclobacteriaceae bacterium]